MTEIDFKIAMCEYFVHNATELMYHELKANCKISVSDELYERYFNKMKNDGFFIWGPAPHMYSISDFGKLSHKELKEEIESNIVLKNRDAELYKIAKDNFRYTKCTLVVAVIATIFGGLSLIKCGEHRESNTGKRWLTIQQYKIQS